MTVEVVIANGTGSGYYPAGATVYITAYAPNPGSQFSHWTYGGCTIDSSTSSSTHIHLTSPTFAWASANYSLISYSLTYGVSGSGYISGDDSQSVPYGTQGTSVTAVADADNHFVRWSDNNYNATRQDYVYGTTSYTAIFESDIPTYALTVNNGTGDGNYQSGAVRQIVADSPSVGYHFLKWTGDIDHVENINASTTNVNMPAEAVTVTASYALDDSIAIGKIAGVDRSDITEISGESVADVDFFIGVQD